MRYTFRTPVTLVITDPCYTKCSGRAVINENTIYGDWSCMTYKCKKPSEAIELSKQWDDYYFKFFRDYNFSGKTDEEKKSMSEEFEKKKKEWIKEHCYGEFCADSGRVAVYNLDDILHQNPDFEKWAVEHPWCVTMIPNYTGGVDYEITREGDERSAHICGNGFYTMQSGF